MKTIRLFIGLGIAACIHQNASAQAVNWRSLENTKHLISVGIGWDYGIGYSLGYCYQFKSKLPIALTTQFSIPSGEKPFDDFKTKIGARILLLNSTHFKGAVTVNGIYRRFENPLVRLQNFGSEMKATLGYYKPRWFIAGEVGFDKAIVTHFKHPDLYRKTIYRDVKDGWYEPATGGHFFYGLQTGYTFKHSDITLNFGKVLTQDFKSTPLIPFYLMLGYNYRIR